MAENLNESKDKKEESVGLIMAALFLLEKETLMNFFKDTKNKLNNLFSSVGSNKKEFDDNKSNVNPKVLEKNTENSLNNYSNVHLDESVVKKARNYIVNGGTFHSNTRGTCTWGRNKYKQVCSTGSFNVLWLLGFPKVSKSTEVDLQGEVLTKMGLKYIGEVDPDHPEKNGYKPQDGDTAVWPRFDGRQHQATYIAGHWVSDTIQNKMSCYSSKNEPNVKIYRYTGNN